MKRLYFAGGLLVAALGLSMAGTSLAAAAPQKAGGIMATFPDGTYTVALNGYCDVLTIVKPGAAGAPGVQATDDPNCFASTLYGAASSNAVAMVWEGTGTPSQVIVIQPNGNWVLYYDAGTGTEGIFNSGTWSYAAPSRHGSRSAAQNGGLFGQGQSVFSGAQRLPGPKSFTFNLSFDGYCDGEAINVPGSAGAPGVDGMQTGCVGNPLVGAKAPNMIGMSDYDDALFYVIMSDHTWLIYNDCLGDGNECVVNSGTWSFGIPAKPNKNRTVTPSSGR